MMYFAGDAPSKKKKKKKDKEKDKDESMNTTQDSGIYSLFSFH